MSLRVPAGVGVTLQVDKVTQSVSMKLRVSQD